ncbi:MAG: class I SAM-dependent methyltransferase [Deltaproteobacteria bacterium]|nr:class I SAM-dependent methyltransferase [Deltaproteobacteria bacterium]
MLAFWPDVIRPLLQALAPQSIVEVGSESGKMTQRLLEIAAATGGTVHAVDPAPLFDVDAWQQEAQGRLVVHRQPSLVGLEQIDAFDCVLIDGDHNWYTVHRELHLVERRCKELGQPMPLILLHDVAWPYGRRDLYYDPDSIPAEHRQPWAKQGISPTEAELLPTGGINAHLCNAVREGGPRNGVLTAVEDYQAETDVGFLFVKIPAVFGLAILLPEALADQKPEVEERVVAWAVPEIERFIDRMETARIAMMAGLGG